MSAYFDLILLLAAAVFIFIRLRNVLGTRPENKIEVKVVSPEEFKKAYDKLHRELEADAKTPSIKESPNDEAGSKVDGVLAKIPGFERADFCRRAAQAFEMILQAFASADEATLKMLTNKKLFAGFCSIINQRREEGIQAETDLIKVDEMSIEDAEISAKGVVSIVVKFVSEQVNLLRNKAGEVIEGDENFVQKITDVWTFERNLHSNSPVWLLASTKKR